MSPCWIYETGKIIAEDTPSNLRARLNGRVLELRGNPINVLRHVAHQDEDVEDVAAFGDKLHVRVREGKSDLIMQRLPDEIKSAGGVLTELRAIPSTLEDVFIALSEVNRMNAILDLPEQHATGTTFAD